MKSWRGWLTTARSRPSGGAGTLVQSFLAGQSVRSVAYHETWQGDEWPARVRQVEDAIRAELERLAAENAALRAQVGGRTQL